MIEVTKERFFATVGQMDVHPSTHPDHSSWETRSREVVGRTTPGYLCRDESGQWTNKSRYFAAARFARGNQ